MGLGGSATDRPCFESGAGTYSRGLRCHRWGLRWSRRYERADCAGVGGHAPGRARQQTPGEDHLEPDRIDTWPLQTASYVHPSQVGRQPRGPAVGRRDGVDRRRRRLYVHQQQGAGQCHDHLYWPVRDPQRTGRRLRGVYQQPAERGVPRLWRAAGSVCRRNADEQAGRSPGHQPGAAAPDQRSG